MYIVVQLTNTPIVHQHSPGDDPKTLTWMREDVGWWCRMRLRQKILKSSKVKSLWNRDGPIERCFIDGQLPLLPRTDCSNNHQRPPLKWLMSCSSSSVSLSYVAVRKAPRFVNSPQHFAEAVLLEDHLEVGSDWFFGSQRLMVSVYIPISQTWHPWFPWWLSGTQTENMDLQAAAEFTWMNMMFHCLCLYSFLATLTKFRG